jgi:hypothetical protein
MIKIPHYLFALNAKEDIIFLMFLAILVKKVAKHAAIIKYACKLMMDITFP